MQVILYSTHCPRCTVLKAKLEKKNISFEEINDVEHMLSLGIKTSPTLSVDNKIMEFGEAVKWVNAQ